MTVLGRLHSKKVLSRAREGRQYLYYCAKDVGEMKESLLARMGRSLFGRERLQPILAFLEDETELSAEELEELRDIVARKLKDRGKHR
jgi:predicted transcriptional regulator